MKLFLTAMCGLFCVSTSAGAVELAPHKREIRIDGRDLFIPCKFSQSITKANPSITRVLFSIHSSGFDADQYFENARIAASKVPGAIETSLIVAPQFLEASVVDTSYLHRRRMHIHQANGSTLNQRLSSYPTQRR